MQIIAHCPRCGSSWLLEGSAADKRIRCPKCALLFKVPSLNEVPKAVRVVNASRGPIYVDQGGRAFG